MAEIKSGMWSLVELVKINALLDMQDDIMAAAQEQNEEDDDGT